MIHTPSSDVKKLGKNQFARLFPSLQEAPIQPALPAPDIAELLARLLLIQAGINPPHQTDAEGKQVDDTPAASDRLCIATPELNYLLKMCGKPAGGTFDSLPTRFQKYGGKGLS